MDKFQTICKQRISIHAPREGSDCPAGCPPRRRRDFYPRSPRGERRPDGEDQPWPEEISIHAPREGSDEANYLSMILAMQFLSTLPARGATCSCTCTCTCSCISIHAPREGSDSERPACCRRCRHFYPRSPRGERRQHPPVNKAAPPISIHAPREGSDVLVRAAYHPHRKFLSTLPARGATSPGPAAPSWKTAFLSTLPARGEIGRAHV